MTLNELEPQFLRVIDANTFGHVEDLDSADGIIFVCPKCFREARFSRPGVHSIVCWRPRVEATLKPGPGRWEFVGTSTDDLSLVAGNSSVQTSGPCHAHFFIRGGRIEEC